MGRAIGVRESILIGGEKKFNDMKKKDFVWLKVILLIILILVLVVFSAILDKWVYLLIFSKMK